MNKKFLNINIFLLLFLFIVGFSPQCGSFISNSVYASKIDSAFSDKNQWVEGGISANGGFQDNLNGFLTDFADGKNPNSNEAIKNGAYIAIDNFVKTLTDISEAASKFAIALSCVVIALIGFKVMNSGTGDVFKFIKQKKEISNALICIVFILVIPYLVTSILEFKPPNALVSSLGSNVTEGSKLSDILYTPKSGAADMIKEINVVSLEAEAEWANKLTGSYSSSTGLLSGILLAAYKIVLMIISTVIYAPILFMATVIGSVGFYPLSFDPNMYSEGVYTVLEKFFEMKNSSGITDVMTTVTIPRVADGLKLLTQALNVLFFLVKKICMLSIEAICFYYGIMHLLNINNGDVMKFLKRLFEGVVGMLFFPSFLEFLLDVDSMIAFSIMRITGPNVPGIGLLNLMPKSTDTFESFVILALAVIMACLMISLGKAFFVRRIELSLLYVFSPVFFLKHMMSTSDGSVKKLLDKVLSSVFLTTVYSPLFVVITLLMQLGSGKPEGSFIYYLLIIGILLSGKQVITNILGLFQGGSVAANTASSAVSSGLDNASKKVTIGGVATVAASTLAYGAIAKGGTRAIPKIGRGIGVAADAFNNGNLGEVATNSIKSGINNVTSKGKSAFANGVTKFKGGKDDFTLKDGAKKVGKGVLKFGEGAFNLTQNIAESALWDTYDKEVANPFKKYTPQGAGKDALDKRQKHRYDREKEKEDYENAKQTDEIFKKHKGAEAKKLYNMNKNKDKDKEVAREAYEKNRIFHENAERVNQKYNDEHLKKIVEQLKDNNTKIVELMTNKSEYIKSGNYAEAYNAEMQIRGYMDYNKALQTNFNKTTSAIDAKQNRTKAASVINVVANNNATFEMPKLDFDKTNAESVLIDLQKTKSFAGNTDLDNILKNFQANSNEKQLKTDFEAFISKSNLNGVIDKSEIASINASLAKMYTVPSGSENSIIQHVKIVNKGLEIGDEQTRNEEYSKQIKEIVSKLENPNSGYNTVSILDHMTVMDNSNQHLYNKSSENILNTIGSASSSSELVAECSNIGANNRRTKTQTTFNDLKGAVSSVGGNVNFKEIQIDVNNTVKKANQSYNTQIDNKPIKANYVNEIKNNTNTTPKPKPKP